MQPSLVDARVPSEKFLPVISYKNLDRAIDWLEASLGFRKLKTKSDANGHIVYAQLIRGTNVVAVVACDDTSGTSKPNQNRASPDHGLRALYISVDDVDAHFAHAKAAKVDALKDIQASDDGERSYSCRDPEGHVWKIGTRDRWLSRPAPAASLPLLHQKLAKLTGSYDPQAVIGVALMIGAVTISGTLLYAVTRNTHYHSAQKEAVLVLAKADMLPAQNADSAELSAIKARSDQAEQELTAAKNERDQEQVKRKAAEEAASALQSDVERLKAQVAAAEAKAVTPSIAAPAPQELAAPAKAPLPVIVPTGTDTSPLAEGHRYLAKGEIEAARKLFRRAAEAGSIEGALALGSTYDPAGLERLGLPASNASPPTARRWYRKAHELASVERVDEISAASP